MRPLLLTLVLASASLAQNFPLVPNYVFFQPQAGRYDSEGNQVPANTWRNAGSRSFFGRPTTIGYCAWKTNEDGSRTPIKGLLVKLNGWATLGSGWHSHETNNIWRPAPILTNLPDHSEDGNYDNSKLITDETGCVYWLAYPPDISGWYTYIAYPLDPNVPVGGVNVYYALNRFDWINFMTYSGNLTSGITQDVATAAGDKNHSGHRFHMDSLPAAALVGGLADYTNSTYTFDKPTLIRIAMPSGGMVDDHVLYRWYSPPNGPPGQYGGPYGNTDDWWTPYTSETHESGKEVDIVNPVGLTGDSSYYSKMVTAMLAHGCTLGSYVPGDASFSSVGNSYVWWSTKEYLHFDCEFIQ